MEMAVPRDDLTKEILLAAKDAEESPYESGPVLREHVRQQYDREEANHRAYQLYEDGRIKMASLGGDDRPSFGVALQGVTDSGLRLLEELE